MGDSALVYQTKLLKTLNENFIHLRRIHNAFGELSKQYTFPLSIEIFRELIDNIQNIAFADQAIYRFSKLQDGIGAKLFKAFLLAQGENVDKPFLDILHTLEKLNIVDVDEWFILREIRNEIAHDYEENEENAMNILNTILDTLPELEKILVTIQSLMDNKENSSLC
jgi:hypothetical protein